MGTNDVHGELVAQADRGGITTFSGYVAAVREARSGDGALLLVDAGDMWQGTLESNLNEGYSVVDAYNALGYAAAAVGNHEFDFGPAGPKSIPEDEDDDPQGALRARASKAAFPLLAANLIDSSTGEMVEWDNVLPSVMVMRAGVRVGIVGVLTESTPATTIAANTRGIEIAPLAETIEKHARLLRGGGAELVVVVAHAGSRCTEFDDPYDTSSCDMSSEIMRVAQALPPGLVNHILGGHQHQGVAHVVNDIAVTAGYSNTRAFSRVDFTIDRSTGAVVERKIFPPQTIWAPEDSESPGEYEGVAIAPMPEIVAIAERAQGVAERRKSEELGVYLETPFEHRTRPESPLGNLMTDAMLESNDADIAVHNIWGGIRAELPAGDLTFGSVYRVFPFDNRVAIVELSGAELRAIIARQAHNTNRAAGFSGMQVFVSCDVDEMTVRMLRPDGSEISDDETLKIVANDFLLLGGDDIFTPVTPEGGFAMPNGTPLVRDALVSWFRNRGGSMNVDDFFDPDNLRWNRPDPMPAECRLR
jgi:5'-nucleotidase